MSIYFPNVEQINLFTKQRIRPFSFLLLLIGAFLLMGSPESLAQVTNDNQVNYYVRLEQVRWNVNTDSGPEEAAWRFFWRKNQAYTLSCAEANYASDYYCFNNNGNSKEHKNWMSVQQKVFDATNAPTTDKLSYSVRYHENDGANDCLYDQDIFNEDNNVACVQEELRILNFAKLNEWGTFTNNNSGNWAWHQFAAVYRYSKGNSRNEPLTFGTIGSGQTRFHTNSNRSAPSGSTTNVGYTNTVYNSSPDVTYSFRIDAPVNVTIRTNHSTTDFDTRIHLLNNNDSRITENNNTAGSTRSRIDRFLCPGTYKVVVEGNGAAVGTFRLSVFAAKTNTLTAGSISGPSSICQGAPITNLSSRQSGSVPCGNITYQWEQNTSRWESIPGATGRSYDPPGNMGSRAISYRRITKDAYGNTKTSNSITINKTNPSLRAGSIAYNGARTIASGTDPSTITSASNATATPMPNSVFWEKREKNGTSFTTWQAIDGARGQAYNIPPLTKTTEFRRVVTSGCNNNTVSSRAATTAIQIQVVPADGKITGRVLSTSGRGVSGVKVTAVRTTTVTGGTTANGTASDVTNANGEYEITGLYYGSGSANFRVTPTRKDHQFESESVSLNINSATERTANFTDVTVFTLTGNLSQTYNNAICNLEGIKVDLLLNGVVINPNDGFTDEFGNYTLTIENQGLFHTVRPNFEGHTFLPPSQSFTIEDNIQNTDFTDNTTVSLQGFVQAGCSTFMGTAEITLADEENCFEIKARTDGNGFYQINNIPARIYNATVTDYLPIEGYEKLEVLAFFNKSQQVDLSTESKNANFTFHRPPVIEVIGMPEPPCTDIDKSVLAQSSTTLLTIRVWEEGGTCPVDTGTISINNQIGDLGDEPITFGFKGGVFEYELRAGNPNIIYPHFKNLTISAIDTFERSDNYNVEALVTGGRPREKNFSTQSPELPLLILRDPPGDESYSYLEKNTTSETATRFYSSRSESTNKWGNVRIGTKFGISILRLETETAFWGDVGGSYAVNSTNASANETIIALTNTERFETTDNAVITGSEGDVFVGAAFAFAYAISDEVLFDEKTCQVLLDKNLVLANEGLATEFIYTEKHIKESVIPELRMLAAAPDNTDANRADYANQILVWEQMLQRNDELKANATFKERISFGGNSPKDLSVTETTTETSTIEFGMEIDEEIASEMGFEIAGSGVNGGLITNFKMESGNSEATTNVKSLTTGYRLSDNDPLDEFTVAVKTDPVYKTPVFETEGGQSSCPVEPKTNARESVKLRADNPIQASIPADGTATFTLFAGNTSETDETRDYNLRFKQVTNIGGAAITMGGNASTIPIALDDIGAGTESPITVTVTRGVNSPIYSYEGLEFELYSGCDEPDESVVSTIDLTAFFQNPCSEINLAAPADGFILSQTSNNELLLRINGYDVNNLDQVTVEYRPAGTSIWSTGLVLEQENLLDSEFGTEIIWDILNLADGEYELRLKLACDINTIFSSRIKGRLDRKVPEVLGTPEPADDNYVLADPISINFTEALNCESLSAADVVLKRTFTGERINAQLACFNNQVVITPNIDISTFNAEPMEVILSNVQDVYGNTRSTPVMWTFNVGGDLTSLDFDEDGVPNPLDKCAGFDDNRDSDGDGIPDACDPCAEISNKGLSFDGQNDFVNIDNLTGFNSTTNTVEAWIYFEELPSIRSWPLHIGNGGSGQHWLLSPDGRMQMGAWGKRESQLLPLLQAKQWIHLAAVADANSYTVYVNGFKVGTAKGEFSYPSSKLNLGRPISSGTYFSGIMDEVRVWNTARTQAEISASMGSELDGDETGLLLYYKFNEVENLTTPSIVDNTSRGNTGTINNFTMSANSANSVIGAPILEADSDRDGIGNNCDKCAGFSDLLDADADGVADGCDLCPNGDDSLDADMDSVPDACDICAGSDDALDTDLDGTPDGCDLCEGSDDAIDTDTDGVPDACDVCADSDDALDADGDSVPDGCDICAGFDDAEFPTIASCPATVFADYPFLLELVDPDNCTDEKVTVFASTNSIYIYVESTEGGVLYREDGTRYCADFPGFSCLDFYLFEFLLSTWSCPDNAVQPLVPPLSKVDKEQKGNESSLPTFDTKEMIPLNAPFKIFPNPTDGQFFVQLVPSSQNQIISILDVRGVRIQQFKVAPTTTVFLQAIDLTSHSTGIYFIQVINELGIQTLPVVKK